MTTVRERIQSRGYWHRVFQPLPFKESRVEYARLFALVQQTVVDYRGWGFPKINPGMPPEHGMDYVGHVFDWEDRLELWRFYTSGQFVSLQGFMLDWRERATFAKPDLSSDVPTAYLGLLDTVGSFTEFFEFAARLAMTEAGEEEIIVKVTARGLERRTLISESPLRRLHQPYRTSVREFPYEKQLSRTQLVAEPRELALEGVGMLFQRFGCHIDLATLRSIQSELMR